LDSSVPPPPYNYLIFISFIRTIRQNKLQTDYRYSAIKISNIKYFIKNKQLSVTTQTDRHWSLDDHTQCLLVTITTGPHTVLAGHYHHRTTHSACWSLSPQDHTQCLLVTITTGPHTVLAGHYHHRTTHSACWSLSPQDHTQCSLVTITTGPHTVLAGQWPASRSKQLAVLNIFSKIKTNTWPETTTCWLLLRQHKNTLYLHIRHVSHYLWKNRLNMKDKLQAWQPRSVSVWAALQSRE